jgi:hypothetical protein
MASWNPAMKNANIDFREFGGEAINWREPERPKKRTWQYFPVRFAARPASRARRV